MVCFAASFVLPNTFLSRMRNSPAAVFLRSITLGLCLSGGVCLAGQAAEVTVIRIGTLPGLRYDLSAFSVKPGADVQIIFTNTDEMLHNFVLVRPGARLEVVNAAIATGTVENDFVP